MQTPEILYFSFQLAHPFVSLDLIDSRVADEEVILARPFPSGGGNHWGDDSQLLRGWHLLLQLCLLKDRSPPLRRGEQVNETVDDMGVVICSVLRAPNEERLYQALMEAVEEWPLVPLRWVNHSGIGRDSGQTKTKAIVIVREGLPNASGALGRPKVSLEELDTISFDTVPVQVDVGRDLPDINHIDPDPTN